ncbi:hypothetical protein Moror_15371 [Moniliophthora roreri MCA 2997]|uniref:Uncharacterized protein n=1 Tax=Moniliophthora roreri (strain MCA 2997) TaxID=1381753 RepID=V2X4S9_MONRO|nr:hypothetical protein Moror_15371 [Moniliophthora roreri MCA 2997]
MSGIRKAKRFKLKGRDFSQSRDTFNFYGSSDKDADEDRLNSPFPPSHRFPGRSLDDSERYARLFMMEQRGYPLWSPAPNSSLPIEYIRKGVQIGDLGVITEDGMFDFLCNITLKAEDPIHTRHGVPRGFVPLECPLDIVWDKRFHSNRHHLCSPKYESWKDSIIVSELDMRESPRYREAIEFTSADRITEGAILVLPEGCSRIDLKDKQPFLDHAIENALSWFEYADSRGRTRAGKTSTLYLTTGCDKATAWGVASFIKHSDRQVTLPFYTIAEADGGTRYEWGIDKSCSARCAPEAYSDPDDSVPERHINQCLFLRGYRISRDSEDEEKLHLEQDLAATEHEHELLWDIDKHHRNDTFVSWRRGSNSSPLSYRPQDALNLTMSETEPKPYHPCDDINRFLSNALRISSRNQSRSDWRPIISISHDEDWCSPDKGVESYPLVPRYTRYIWENLKVTIRDNIIYTDDQNGLRLSTSLSSCQSLFSFPYSSQEVSDSLSNLSSDQTQSRRSPSTSESAWVVRNLKRETPDPTLLSLSSASSKRPRTPDDDEDMIAMPPPEPRPRKKRPAVRKGWKGWVEGSPPPSEKLINLDAMPFLQESRTRSGKNFDALGEDDRV